MDISTVSEEANRGRKDRAETRARVYPRRRGTATDCGARKSAIERLSWEHDGAFPLPEHLCSAAGELFCPGRADARLCPPADQAEPALGAASGPRSRPAR